MKLSVMERIVAFGVLPKSASFDTWKTLRGLQRKLTLDEKESKAVGFTVDPEGQRMTWDAEKDPGKEVPLSAAELKLIQDGFKALDAKGALVAEQADVMAKFVDATV